MPNFYNFEKLLNIKTIEVNPNGWVNPLFIEYGFDDQDMPSCCWRVKNTKHTFTIPVLRLDYLSGGNYAEHFTKVLEGFREDYLEWKEKKFFTDWMQEYRREYANYILV